MLKIKVISAHPEMFPGTLGYSIIGKALKEKKFMLDVINLHDFGIDNRKTIDDEPFGGGPGMILRPDVVEKALLNQVQLLPMPILPSQNQHSLLLLLLSH